MVGFGLPNISYNKYYDLDDHICHPTRINYRI